MKILNSYLFLNYYKKNLCYVLILVIVGALDVWLCSWFFIGYGWISVAIHAFIVLITVPTTYICVYWKSHECKYLRDIVLRILKKSNKKNVVQ